jgi:hypothetical protein
MKREKSQVEVKDVSSAPDGLFYERKTPVLILGWHIM